MGPVKPGRLRPGDTVAVVSPSWGGPSRFPAVYEHGLRVLERELGLVVREMPHARTDADRLARHPELRAEDIAAALADPTVRALWCSIGGDDLMRVIPHLDPELPRKFPKVVVGYSDSSVLLTWLRRNGVIAFHGPSIMAGISQWPSLPKEFGDQLRAVLFEPTPSHRYRPFAAYSEGYVDWGDPASVGQTKSTRTSEPWHRLNGERPVDGELFGGNLESLEQLKGTPQFPPVEFFDGKLLFLEISEEHPPPVVVVRMLRNYGVSGILGRIAGLLFGRPRGYTDTARRELDAGIRRTVVEEFGRADLPIVTHLDFGHTDPQWVLPVGGRARLDPAAPSLELLEPAVA
ncbi:MAG: LD-carboxypeptidase [Thermoplasmata archaeon]|nr:LD-carboxypeptidase [Thermoplasmata archaeon]